MIISCILKIVYWNLKIISSDVKIMLYGLEIIMLLQDNIFFSNKKMSSPLKISFNLKLISCDLSIIAEDNILLPKNANPSLDLCR